MTCGHVFVSQPGFDHVPLSCVPPMTSHGIAGLIATFTNCSVSRFRLMCVIWVGIRDSSRRQAGRLAAEGGRVEVQSPEVSWNVPSVRIIPPSEPSKICVGL